MFTLPAEGARCGLVVVVVLLGAMWWLTRCCYRRILALLGDPTRGAGGGAAFGQAMATAGAGRAGHRLAFVGVGAYVIPATIGYATFGSRAIVDVARLLAGQHLAGTAMAAAGTWAACSGAARLDNPLAGRLARQLGVWAAGAAIAAYLHGPWRIAAAVVVFTAGAFAAAARHDTPTQAHRANQLDQGHLTSIAALGLQVALMVALAAAAGWIVVTTPAGLHIPALVGSLAPKDLLLTIGVLAFALVGTGWTNLHIYPAMANPGFRQRTADTSLLVVLCFQGAWLIIASLVLRGSDLLALDNHHATSAKGISDLVAGHATGWPATTIALLAAAVVGIAVTGAANGFTESLALEWHHLRSHAHPDRDPATDHQVTTTKRIILAGCALTAGAAAATDIPVSAILAFGGLAGGAVLVWIMGAIAEPDPRQHHRARRYALAAAVTAIITTATLTAIKAPPGPVRIAATIAAIALTTYTLHLTHNATNPTKETHP